MSDELKPCPFCGSKAFAHGNLVRCGTPARCATWMYIPSWQQRPLEDHLRAELDEAKVDRVWAAEMVAKLTKAEADRGSL